MKLVIFGATGGLGQPLVRLALDQGHTVTAAVRNPDGFGQKHERLRVVRTDVADAKSVAAAVDGQEGVISVIGPRPGTPPGTLISDTARYALQGMAQHGVRRLSFASGLMVGDARGMNPLQRVGIRLFRAMNRALYEDKVRAERLIHESSVDWTIVRPPVFGDIPARGKYRLGEDLDGRLAKMSSADVAAAMLEALTDARWVRKTLELSY